MKEIMAAESSGAGEGAPSFEYNPADEEYAILFEYGRPLSELKHLLLRCFAGRRLSMKEVFESHHVGTPFIERNYKAVLLEMEKDGLIEADPPAAKRPRRYGKPTFGPKTEVTFPDA